jgi:hypothetical protein
VSFCFVDVGLQVLHISASLVCSGGLCDGLYALGKCPCVRTTQLPQYALSIQFHITRTDEGEVTINQCAELGIKLQTFTSVSLTATLVNQLDLQVSLLPQF